nr:hypothetical protein [Sphingosinicella sp. CPCC 101087]
MSAASILKRCKIALHHRIGVADDRGEVIVTARFGDVVAVEGQPRF